MKLVLLPTPHLRRVFAKEQEQNYVPKLPLGTSDIHPEALRPHAALSGRSVKTLPSEWQATLRMYNYVIDLAKALCIVIWSWVTLRHYQRLYSICYGSKGASLTFRDVHNCVVIRKLLNYIFEHISDIRAPMGNSKALTQDWLRAGQPRTRNSKPGKVVHTGSEAHPTSYPTVTLGSFPGGEESEAWSWPLTTSVEVKKTWIYTSTPPYVFMA
jgi:hypothetical protein